MRLVYRANSELPPLVWLARMRKGSEEVVVTCGDAVECKPQFFVAGVWDGEFQEGRFDKASFACCTGGILNNVKTGR